MPFGYPLCAGNRLTDKKKTVEWNLERCIQSENNDSKYKGCKYSVFIFACLHTRMTQLKLKSKYLIAVLIGGRGGSIGRALASRSNGFHGQRFESRPEHKTNL